MLLSSGAFAVVRIMIDIPTSTIPSSCVLINSLADSNIWSVDVGGRLLMTLQPLGDEAEPSVFLNSFNWVSRFEKADAAPHK